MNEPIHRSNWVLDSFVDEVRGCQFVEDWNLDDNLVIEIAQLLWDYRSDTLTDDHFLQIRQRAYPKNSKTLLDNFTSWAEQGESLLTEINKNPYLIDALWPAYQEALKDWPDEVMLRVPNFESKSFDVFAGNPAPPENAATDLVELQLRLNRLVIASQNAKTPDNLPKPKVGKKNINDKRGFVATALDLMLSKHIETAVERRACILELFPLVGQDITDKALQDML